MSAKSSNLKLICIIYFEILRKDPLKRFYLFNFVYSPEFTFFPLLESRSSWICIKGWVDKLYAIDVCRLVISSNYKINEKCFTQFSSNWKKYLIDNTKISEEANRQEFEPFIKVKEKYSRELQSQHFINWLIFSLIVINFIMK